MGRIYEPISTKRKEIPFIKRKLHPYGDNEWVKYNHEKWVVRTYGDNIYHLAYAI